MAMKHLARLEKTKECWFLIAILVLFFFLRLPSLFEPNWYGDEGIYQALGRAMYEGKVLYREIWDNKTPLLYALYGIFNADQFSLRLLSLVSGIGAITAFFFFSRKLFTNSNAHFASTTIFALLFGLPIIEGNIANSENFMIPLLLLAGLLVFNVGTLVHENIHAIHIKQLVKPLFAAGILLSLAFLLKIVAIFDVAACMLFLFFVAFSIHTRSLGRTMLQGVQYTVELITPFALGFLLPIGATIAVLFFQNALGDFISAAFSQNVGYVGYGNRYIIPQGLLIGKLFLLFLSVCVLFFYRHRFSLGTLFLFLWLAFSIFNAYFSQRPYTHYLLTLLPPFALLVGYIVNTTSKHARLAAIGIVFLLCFFSYRDFWLYDKNVAYYKNFVDYLSNRKTLTAYQAFFDRKTPRDYAIAEYIRMNTTQEEGVFIWGNSAQTYVLANKLPPGKFTVAYHMLISEKTLAETKADVERQKPKIIVLMAKEAYPYNLSGYQYKFTIDDAHIYERR